MLKGEKYEAAILAAAAQILSGLVAGLPTAPQPTSDSGQRLVQRAVAYAKALHHEVNAKAS